jgi:hypothetical protein
MILVIYFQVNLTNEKKKTNDARRSIAIRLRVHFLIRSASCAPEFFISFVTFSPLHLFFPFYFRILLLLPLECSDAPVSSRSWEGRDLPPCDDPAKCVL